MDTEEGTPQGRPGSPLPADICRNEFDQEFAERGVRFVRGADDMVIPAKSRRAAERLRESSTRSLERKRKLKGNQEKSRVVSVFSIRDFKFLGFALGRNGGGTYVRVPQKAWRIFQARRKELSSRRSVQSLKPAGKEIEVYARGWLNWCGIASMRHNPETINGRLCRRIRKCIWDHRKRRKTERKNRMKLGVPRKYAYMAAASGRGSWLPSNLSTVKSALTKERLIRAGFYDRSNAYQSVHVRC